jgi:hypothetical protein
MVGPTKHIKNPVQDHPPHLTGTSIFNITKIELFKELIPISNPIYSIRRVNETDSSMRHPQ